MERSKLACPPAPRAQSLQKGNDRRAKRRSDSTDAPVTQTNGPGSRQHRQNGALLGSCSHSTGAPVTQRVGLPTSTVRATAKDPPPPHPSAMEGTHP